MGVVLPREPDPAVQLDVLLRAHDERGKRLRRGDGDRELELGGAGLGARRVPRGRGGELGGDEHVGGLVLDRLEHSDHPPELLAHLGVLARHGHARRGTTRRLGGGEEATEHDCGVAGAGEDAVGGRLRGEGDRAHASGGVGVRRDRDGDLVAGGDHEIVAAGEEEQVGEPGAEDEVRGVVEPDRAAHGAVGQPGQVCGPLRVAARGGEHARRPDRREEGAGRDRRAQRLDHDHELGEPEAGAAMGFGQVETEPAEVGHLLPRRGERLLGGVEQRPGLGAGAGALEERVGDAGELQVVLGDRDTHGIPPLVGRGQTIRGSGARGNGSEPSNRGRSRAGARRHAGCPRREERHVHDLQRG